MPRKSQLFLMDHKRKNVNLMLLTATKTGVKSVTKSKKCREDDHDRMT